MRILFLGLNYAPEEIGIAAYSTGMCEDLVKRGHEVQAIVGKPYYPGWSVPESFQGGGARHSVENGVDLTRVPHYVPGNPTGARRIIHHATFALNALLPMVRASRAFKPDVVLTIAPSTIAAPVARLAAKLAGAKSWLHIQDFEVGAAFATGLVSPSGVTARLARTFEKWVVGGFDRISSISHEMCKSVGSLGIPEDHIVSFRNWAEIEQIAPLDRASEYRERWGISAPHVVLYSGNIANKQGIGIVVDAARTLADRDDIEFVVCGNGPNRAALEKHAEDLTNIQFHDLQPKDQLCELMNLATIHLLPQRADAADLVLPSKLTNMLASGRPVIATANNDTGLAQEVSGNGLVVQPEDTKALANAIALLADDEQLRTMYGSAARIAALANWHKDKVLSRFEADLQELAVGPNTFVRLDKEKR